MDQIFICIGVCTLIGAVVIAVIGLLQTVRQVFANVERLDSLDTRLSEKASQYAFDLTKQDVAALYLAAKKAGWSIP